MKRIFLSVVACGLCSCMSWDLGVLQTEAGWTLFSYADAALDANRAIAVQALRFDLYYRQTTDEGRRVVQDRYFPTERIVNDGDVWRIVTHNSTWMFELADGMPLRSPDSKWTITYAEKWRGERLKAMVVADDVGYLAMSSEMEVNYFKTVAKLKLSLAEGEGGAMSLGFVGGDVELVGRATPRLYVFCSIDSPVMYHEKNENPEAGGRLCVQAHNEAENADELVRARYLTNGDVEITYRGKTQLWRDRWREMLPE